MNRERKSESLRDWVPYQLKAEKEEEQCRWLYLGDTLFTHPFFDDTIQHCRSQFEINRKNPVMSTTAMLPDWSDGLQTLQPSALIFHVSRCGSTLLSQLLSQLTDSVVLSEVPFLDAMLRRAFLSGWQTGREEEALAAFRFYLRPRKQGDQHVFIKTDSWHLHFHPFWQRHFPGIPRVLLYRHPAEVIRSQQKRRGLQSVPGLVEPAVFGWPDELRGMTDFDQYMGQVLKSYYQQMLSWAATDPHAWLCNYREGMMEVATRIVGQIGELPTTAITEQWAQRSRYHGKYPEEHFSEEPVSGEQPAWMQELVELYEQLETCRLRPRPTS